MSAAGTTLVTKPDDGAMVDAYVDALLAMPLAQPPVTPASPGEPPSFAPAARAEPTPEESGQMDARAAGELAVTRPADGEGETETAAAFDITPRT